MARNAEPAGWGDRRVGASSSHGLKRCTPPSSPRLLAPANLRKALSTDQSAVIEKILTHLRLWPAQEHGPPASAAAAQPRLELRVPPGRPSVPAG